MQAAAGTAVVALAVFFVLTWSRSRTFAQGSAVGVPLPSGTALAPPAAPPAPAAPKPAAEPTPPPAPAPAPTAAATAGTITALMKGGHRVWIDSKIVGQSPASFSVACGPHAVRVGSHGSTRHVDVACGSEVFVK